MKIILQAPGTKSKLLPVYLIINIRSLVSVREDRENNCIYTSIV